MNRFVLPALLSGAALFLLACGETFTEVAARNQADIDKLRADFTKLAELAAADPPAKDLAAPLDPAPKFDGADEDGSNAALLPVEKLAEPTKTFPDDQLMDFYLSHGLENIFEWSSREGKAFDKFEEGLKQSLGTRYLVGYKMIKMQAPTVDANLNYTVGGGLLAVHVFDRTRQEIVASMPVAALSNENIEYQYREGDDKAVAAQKWARSSLWENLRTKTLETLAEKTGGTFKAR